MTITYPNGTVLEAIVLSHDEDAIRAIAPGNGDVLAFSCIQGAWISEELEPVTIEFEWQRRGAPTAGSEDACICPTELATRLIQSLFAGCEPGDAASEAHFNSEGCRVALRRGELRAMRSSAGGASTVD
jgi:hypothetical protein